MMEDEQENQSPLRWGIAQEPIPGRLPHKARSLLDEVIYQRRPDLLPLLDQLGVTPLTEEQREELRTAVGIEFNITGLREDSEPNQRGLALEKLIDLLGHL